MSMSCGANLMRFVLFTFNFIFWVSGVVLAALGLWLRFDPEVESFMEMVEEATESSQLRNSANLLICVGFFILIIGFLGCCGACKASTWMLCGFSILVSIVIIMELATIGLAIVYRSQLDDKVKEKMLDQVMEEVEEAPSLPGTVSHSWHIMQKSLECCGADGPQDYQGSNYTRTNDKNVPKSCCLQQDPDNMEDFTPQNEPQCRAGDEEFMYNDGCYDKLKDWSMKNGAIVIAAVIIFIILQIIGVVFAMKVRKEVLETQIA